METLNANAAFLCNYEVMQLLQELKDNTQKKHKREGSLATVTYETVHFLQETECKTQTADGIQKFLEAMKGFKLTKTEKLMMVNTPPRSELEIQLVLLSNTIRVIWKKCLIAFTGVHLEIGEIKNFPIEITKLSGIIQESEERLSEEEVQKILKLVLEFLLTHES